MHPRSLEPTMRAADHPSRVRDLDHQLLDQVHHHRDYADSPQMEADGHSIRCHQGPSLLGDTNITEYRGALTLNLALPPTCGSPTHRAVSSEGFEEREERVGWGGAAGVG